MAQGDKSAYYQALKKAGYEFDRHYRDYTTQDLIEICEQIEETTGETVEVAPSAPHEQMPPRDSEMAEMREQFDRLTELVGDLADLVTANVKPSPKPAPDPSEQFAVTSTEHAGLTQNVAGKDGVQFVDEYGNEWYQPEVTKPSYARPEDVQKYPSGPQDPQKPSRSPSSPPPST